MKKLIAAFTLMLAFSINANAQDKNTPSAYDLAKKQAAELTEYLGLDKIQNEEQTFNHCKNSTILNIKFSDIQASNWGVVDICCIICELIAIYILTIAVKPTMGEIMASLSYVHSLCGYFQVFPSVIEQLKQLKVASRFLYLKE